MKQEVVSFDQALELCKLGFNEVTCCGYLIENRELYLCQLEDEEFYKPEKDLHAPLKQQVFRWFRGKYGIYQDIVFKKSFLHMYEIVTINTIVDYDDIIYENGFNTYEEAENACIDKLIELAKQQKQ